MSKKIIPVQSKSNEKNSMKPTLGKNGAVVFGGHEFSRERLLYILKMMLSARSVDNKAMNLLRQGKTFFHIAGAGHEAVQLAIGLSLDPKKDWLFPYYRDIATVLTAGITAEEIFLGTFAKADDPASGGR